MDRVTLHDGAIVEVTRWDEWSTRTPFRQIGLWWHYKVRGYPKPPPLEDDPVYQRLFNRWPDDEGRDDA